METNYSNNRPLGSLKSAATVAATGRTPFGRDLEEAVKLPAKDYFLPPGWLDGEGDEDQYPSLKTPTLSLTIGNSSPADELDFLTTPPSNVVDNALEMDDETVEQSIRERTYSSSSSSTLNCEEARRLLNEIIRENKDSDDECLMDEELDYPIQPNDCFLGDRHEGSNWPQNRLQNNPHFEENSASDPASCGPTIDGPHEECLIDNAFNSSIDDPSYHPPSQNLVCSIGTSVPNGLMLIEGHLYNGITTLPTNNARLVNTQHMAEWKEVNEVVGIKLNHGSLKLIDSATKLFEYRGNYGVFPVTVIDPQYAYEACDEAYQAALQNGNVYFVGMNHADQEMQPNEFQPYQGHFEGNLKEIEQESIANNTESTIDSNEAFLNPSNETKRKVGRPAAYAITTQKPEETMQHARERETQKRARVKKSDQLKKQRMTVKTAYQTLEELGFRPAKLMEALKAHISLQPGNGKKTKEGPTCKGKSNQYRNEQEKLAARRENGKKSAAGFRERRKAEAALLKEIIKLAGEAQMKNTRKSQSTKKAINSVLEDLRSVPF